MSDDEEISIDLSKVKKWFKKRKKDSSEEKKNPASESSGPEKEFHKEEGKIGIEIDDTPPKPEKPEEKTEPKHREIAGDEVKKEKKIFVVEKEDEKEEDSDDVALDFSKLTSGFKGLFKKDKSEKKKIFEDKKEDISFDWKGIETFFNKNKKWIIPVVLILIAVSFSVYFRTMPQRLPITDDWAEDTVLNYYRNQLSAQISQQYPNLPAQNKNSLVNQELAKFLEDNEEMVGQQIAATSQQFKSRMKTDDGQTYLLAIDPYLWYGMARNYIENGHFGNDFDEEGNSIYTLRRGRDSLKTGFHFHTFVIVLIYQFLKLFNGDLSLMGGQFYFPVVLCTLAIFPAYFLSYKLTGSKLAGFFSALMLAVSPNIIARTAGGFADTDSWNVVMPILTVCLFIYAYKSKDKWKKIVFSILGGLSVAIYASAWTGWWHIFDFILAATLVYLFAIMIKTRSLREVYKNSLAPVVFSTASVFFFLILMVLRGGNILAAIKSFFSQLFGPLWFIQYKSVATTKVWPNVLTTVAELNQGSLGGIINSIGGKLFFILALIGMVLLLLPKDKWGTKDYLFIGVSSLWFILVIYFQNSINNILLTIIFLGVPALFGIIWSFLRKEDVDMKSGFLLTIWFLGTIFAALNGIRFNALVVIPFVIGFGVFMGIFYNRISKMISTNFNINLKLIQAVFVVLLLLLLISPVKTAYAVSRSEIPSMNDAWYESLIKIKDNTNDAIITSWWDFGHWFVAIAERRVTFDGGDQGERIHWVGKSLLTSNEQLSVGLLRMLNCGQEKPPHVLEDFFEGDTVKAVDVLNRMMVLNDKKRAIALLEDEGLDNEQIAEIIAVTYCDDLIPQFYITSEDMVGKAGVWGHFGSWDFEKAKMYNQVRKTSRSEGVGILTEGFGLSEEEAEAKYSEIQNIENADGWISPWPNYMSGANYCQKQDSSLECNVNSGGGGLAVEIDLGTMEPEIKNIKETDKPTSFVYADSEGLVEKKFDSPVGFSLILIPEGDNYKLLAADPLQAKSMFTQLFFFKGHGLDCFDLFDERQQLTGAKIYVWKVDWSCSSKNLVYFLPEEEVRAQHILIRTTGLRSEEEALVMIEEVDESLEAGADFEDLAREKSEDPGTKDLGGDLGWFGKGEMVPEFESVVFDLEKGEISEPFKTEYGYHIVKLLDRREVPNENLAVSSESATETSIESPDLPESVSEIESRDEENQNEKTFQIDI